MLISLINICIQLLISINNVCLGKAGGAHVITEKMLKIQMEMPAWV